MKHQPHPNAAFSRLIRAAALAALTAGLVRAAPPVDPGASREARNVLTWLASLPGRTSNKVVSGQNHLSICNSIQSQTGETPGLLGEQLCGLDQWDDWRDAPTRRENLLTHWNNGGIVSVYLLIGNPVSKKGMRDRTGENGTSPMTLAEFRSVYTTGTAANANYNGQLDQAAAHLQWLSDRKVPVLLRPLPEMNGGFWYGNFYEGGQPQSFRKLWQYTFDYLTKTKGLHNLLWVYSVSWWTNAGPQDGDWEYAGYYPGDAYVDITGLDLYPDSWCAADGITTNHCRAYGHLKSLGKPVALAECGPSKKCPGRNDYRKLTTAIHDLMPDVIYWMCWSGTWSMDAKYNDHVGETLNDPWVCNRSEIPNLK